MMRQALLALYPRSWRDQYGEEYCALLEDIGISASVAFDVVGSALKLRLQRHARILSALAVLGQYSLSLWLCVHLRITDNMFWLPTTFLQAAGLAATYVPLLYTMWMYVRDKKLSKRTI
jgi:hypothetical protein